MEKTRPNPDELLAAIQKEEVETKRGKLRLFFGMSAGVGKTYAMLRAAHEQKRGGTDIVVGLVETHGRADTAALLEGLEVIPRQKFEYRGTVLEEMDLEAILARRPALVLVDELAHTNAPGARHPKRYQDVIELLEAGIDVYSTMNVQHLESRVDVVQLITAVNVRETVPDSVLDLADQIELIDISPEELLKRFRQGKIYPGERAGRAMTHFFQPSNLTALREIALRATADKVDQDLQGFAADRVIEGPWGAGERLMVAVSHSPFSERLIRAARRMAVQMDTSWIALYVDTGHSLSDAEQNRLVKNLELARELGGEVVTTQDSDVVAAIQRVAHNKGVVQIVIGRPERRWIQDLWRGGSLVDRLVREIRGIDVHVIRQPESESRPLQFVPRFKAEAKWFNYFWATLFIIVVAAGSAFLSPVLGYRAVGFLFLLAVILIGLFVSIGPTLLAASLSAVIWNYFFIPPIFAFHIATPEDVMMFLTYFVAAMVTGIFTYRLKRQQRALRQREEKTNILYEILKAMTLARGVDAVMEVALKRISDLFGAEAAVLASEDLQSGKGPSYGAMKMDEKELAVAAWSYEQGKVAGWSTDTLPMASSMAVSLKLGDRKYGVLMFRPNSQRELTPDQENLLFVIANQIAVALAKEEFDQERNRTLLFQESERFHQTLLNSISHELRTPLTAILGAASALQEKATSADPIIRREMSEEIVDSVDRLNRVVENLLDMTRLESGMLKPKREWFDLAELVSEALIYLKRPLAKHLVDWAQPEKAVYFEGDFHLLEHAFINLLLNAAAYSPPSSTIVVRLEAGADRAKILIRDRGPGIPGEHRDRVFEKFFRLPGSPTGGLGLGLSIAKSLVDLHAGEVGMANLAGGGSEFWIELPLAEIPRQVSEVER